MSKHGVTDFLSGLGAGFLDPINFGASFVPVPGMGATKVAGWLGKAGSFGGRTAIRAMQGAASGALGMALVEPMIAAGQKEIQADYTMAQSLQNIAFGAIMGGALHPVAGGFGEWRRARNGQAQTWEYVPDSRESEELMRANARRIAKTRLEAEPGLDPAKVEADSKADALLWDFHMRNMAYLEQTDITSMYAHRGYELRNGELFHQQTRRAMDRIAALEKEMGELESMRDMAGQFPELGIRFNEREYADIGRKLDLERGNMLEAQRAARADIAEMTGGNSLYAMHKSSAKTLSEFAEGVSQKRKGFEKATFVSEEIFSRQEAELADARMEAPHFTINHIRNGHPNFNSWDKLVSLAKEGALWEIAKDAQTGNRGWLFAARNGEKILAMIGYSKNGKHGSRLVLSTAFEGSEKGFNGWLKNNKAASTYHGPGGTPGLPKPVETGRLHELSQNGEQTLFQSESSVNSRVLGSTTFRENALPVIRLFAEHDASTVRHELAHVIRRNLAASAMRPNANPVAAKRYAALERAFGVTDGKWTVEQEEAFARTFERYLHEGRVPVNELTEAFETIKAGMADVYASADALGVEISNEVRGLFNGMFAVPMAEGKWQFNKAMAEILSGRWADMDNQAHLNQASLYMEPAMGARMPTALSCNWKPLLIA